MIDIGDRDRLLLAFADLSSYGILAREACGSDPAETGRALAAQRAEDAPQGLGSYVFWSGRDESRFDPEGRLSSPLPLHTSGQEVVPAVRAALARFGLTARHGGTPGVVLCTGTDAGEAPSQPTGGFWGAVRAGRRRAAGLSA